MSGDESIAQSLDDDTPSDDSKCICCHTPKELKTSRDLRIGWLSGMMVDLKTLRQAAEDDCPDCGLILDAVLTFLSLRPDLEYSRISISVVGYSTLISPKCDR